VAPTLLSEEKTYNIFMRAGEPEIMELTGQATEIESMRYLREWKTRKVRPAK
jgi:hypothetical protein